MMQPGDQVWFRYGGFLTRVELLARDDDQWIVRNVETGNRIPLHIPDDRLSVERPRLEAQHATVGDLYPEPAPAGSLFA